MQCTYSCVCKQMVPGLFLVVTNRFKWWMDIDVGFFSCKILLVYLLDHMRCMEKKVWTTCATWRPCSEIYYYSLGVIVDSFLDYVTNWASVFWPIVFVVSLKADRSHIPVCCWSRALRYVPGPCTGALPGYQLYPRSMPVTSSCDRWPLKGKHQLCFERARAPEKRKSVDRGLDLSPGPSFGRRAL